MGFCVCVFVMVSGSSKASYLARNSEAVIFFA